MHMAQRLDACNLQAADPMVNEHDQCIKLKYANDVLELALSKRAKDLSKSQKSQELHDAKLRESGSAR